MPDSIYYGDHRWPELKTLSLGRSGFRKIVILNAHGHHPPILQLAARKVADQSDVCMICTDIFKMAADAEQGAAMFNETVQLYVELLRDIHAAP